MGLVRFSTSNRFLTLALFGMLSLVLIMAYRNKYALISKRSLSRYAIPSMQTVSTTAIPQQRSCETPKSVQNGMPWPECANKILWLYENWKSDPCYAKNGVNGSICSIISYLSEKENMCPPAESTIPRGSTDYFKGVTAEPRASLDQVIDEFEGMHNMIWVRNRMIAMQEIWEDSARNLFFNKLGSFRRKKKRIHLHLGLLSLGMGEAALLGGPLGELLQWSDLIASLYIMGHDIVVTRSRSEASHVYEDYLQTPTTTSCSSGDNFPFDIVYTDIAGYYMLSPILYDRMPQNKCRFRILDSFGTEAVFNVAQRSNRNQFGGLKLDLRQFHTMFPHSPDNTFLGFVVENPAIRDSLTKTRHKQLISDERDIALIYSKEAAHWKDAKDCLKTIKEYFPKVHATVAGKHRRIIPDFVVNHGLVSQQELFQLLRQTKVYIGLGRPFEGPGPLEAIAMGGIFINPKYATLVNSENNVHFQNKPTKRSLTSQNPYAEKFIGKPHVYTIDIHNEEELRATLKEISENRNQSLYLPYELTTEGMLERVAVQVEKLDICDKSSFAFSNVEPPMWPPRQSLQIVKAPDASSSCNEACEREGLRCEQAYFPLVNRVTAFERSGLKCKSEEYPYVHRVDYPAYDAASSTCYFQTHNLYFSCADSQTNFVRLCPCRDFRPEQVALCTHCVS